MTVKKSFFLDKDEREVVDCLIENSIIKQKIIKYATYHGHYIKDRPFEYNRETGEVVYFEDNFTKGKN